MSTDDTEHGPGSDQAETPSTDEDDPYIDAANRLERTLDTQIQAIRDIDSRAGYITRLIAILLGVVVSAGSIAATLAVDNGSVPTFSPVTSLMTVIAAVALLGTMMSAIITYLNSHPVAGLEYRTAELLSNPAYETDMDTHVRRVLGVYAHALRVNAEVIHANSVRFRRVLTLLLVGLIYGTATALLLLLGSGSLVLEGLAFLVVTGLTTVFVWYISTGRYLVHELTLGHNERTE